MNILHVFIFISSLWLVALSAQSSDNANYEAVELEEIATDEIVFEETDFFNAKWLFNAIKREISKFNQGDNLALTKKIPEALKAACSQYHVSLHEIYDHEWRERKITVLHYAAWIKGNSDVVEVLLNTLQGDELKNFIDQTDKHGYSALHFASISGDKKTCLLLLKACGNPSKILSQYNSGEFSCTPSGKACFWCNYKTKEFLDQAEDAYEKDGDQGVKDFLDEQDLLVADERSGQKKSCCPLL